MCRDRRGKKGRGEKSSGEGFRNGKGRKGRGEKIGEEEVLNGKGWEKESVGLCSIVGEGKERERGELLIVSLVDALHISFDKFLVQLLLYFACRRRNC